MKVPKFITQADYEKAVLQNIERSKAIDELNKLILAKMKPAYENMNGAFHIVGSWGGGGPKTDAYIFEVPFVECEHVLTRRPHESSDIETVKIIKGLCPNCDEIV